MPPTTGALRWLRSGVITVVSVALALGAHVLAGGTSPGPVALLLAVVPLTCLSVLCTGRPVGRPALVGGLLVTQALLHLWFGATGPGCPVGSGPSGSGGHGLHGGGGGAASVDCAGATSTAVVTGGGQPGWMLLAHVGVVVLTGLLLAHGERLLWDATGSARRLVRPLRAAPVRIDRLPTHVRASLPTARRLPASRHASRRGPPSGAALRTRPAAL